jgi:hypothetical protein
MATRCRRLRGVLHLDAMSQLLTNRNHRTSAQTSIAGVRHRDRRQTIEDGEATSGA